jgi:hypothetical protein
MSNRISLAEVEETSVSIGVPVSSAVPRLEQSLVTLRCGFLTADNASLEALRYARRAMLREEWTRGVEPDEPSLEDATFSAFDVVWVVRAVERERGLAKLGELVARANRVLGDLSAAWRG